MRHLSAILPAFQPHSRSATRCKSQYRCKPEACNINPSSDGRQDDDATVTDSDLASQQEAAAAGTITPKKTGFSWWENASQGWHARGAEGGACQPLKHWHWHTFVPGTEPWLQPCFEACLHEKRPECTPEIWCSLCAQLFVLLPPIFPPPAPQMPAAQLTAITILAPVVMVVLGPPVWDCLKRRRSKDDVIV